MKDVKNWLMTNIEGEKLSPAWFFFNLFSIALLVIGILSLIFK